MDLRIVQQHAFGLYSILASLALTEATTRAGTVIIDRWTTAECWLQAARLTVFLAVVVRVYLITGDHVDEVYDSTTATQGLSTRRPVLDFTSVLTHYVIVSFWALSIDRPSSWSFYVLMLVVLTHYVYWLQVCRADTSRDNRISGTLDVAAALASLVVRATFWVLVRVGGRTDAAAFYYSEMAAFVPVILICLFDTRRCLGSSASSC